jgi:hypothetical protein
MEVQLRAFFKGHADYSGQLVQRRSVGNQVRNSITMLTELSQTYNIAIVGPIKQTPWLESAGANYTDRATAACRRS